MSDSPIDLHDREALRRTVVSCGALVDYLDALYPLTALPPETASEAVLRVWVAERRLVQRLRHLQEEARKGDDTGELPTVLGS